KDFREREVFAEKLRVEWLESTGQGDSGWVMIGRVSEMITEGTPWLLGKALARVSFADDVEARLLSEASPPHSSIFASIMWSRGELKGQEWLCSALELVVRQGRISEAVQLATVMRQSAPHWDRVDALGNEFATAFWGAVNLWSRDFSTEELDRGVTRLLELG